MGDTMDRGKEMFAAGRVERKPLSALGQEMFRVGDTFRQQYERELAASDLRCRRGFHPAEAIEVRGGREFCRSCGRRADV
jgi:hypothetical protein